MTGFRLSARIAAGPLRALLAAGTAGALLAGCGTASVFDGPEPPENEVVVLEGYWHYYVLAVRFAHISRVDGKFLGASTPVTRLKLSAGQHSIELTVGTVLPAYSSGVALDSRCTFEARFESGRRYRIKSFDESAGESEIGLEVVTTFGDTVTTRTIPCRVGAARAR